MVCRRAALNELGGYAEGLGEAAAEDLWTRVAMSGRRLVNLSGRLVRERRRPLPEASEGPATVSRRYLEWLLLDRITVQEAAATRALLRGEPLARGEDFRAAARLARRVQKRFEQTAGAPTVAVIRARTTEAIVRAAERMGLGEPRVARTLLADLARHDRKRLAHESARRLLSRPKALYAGARAALQRAAGER